MNDNKEINATSSLINPTAVHPEDFCDKCQNSNIVWSVANEIWNKYSNGYEILCPVCFVKQAETFGLLTVWQLIEKRKMPTVYQVVDNGVDGMAHHSLGFFISENDAVRVRDKDTAYGQGSIIKHEICGTFNTYEALKKESAINRAKNKLTNEERDLLGIN